MGFCDIPFGSQTGILLITPELIKFPIQALRTVPQILLPPYKLPIDDFIAAPVLQYVWYRCVIRKQTFIERNGMLLPGVNYS